MAYNTFFLKFSKTDFQLKNLLTCNVFPKFLIRKRFKPSTLLNSSSTVFIVDTNSLFFLKILTQTKVGKSAFFKKIIYTHHNLKKLRIKSFLFSEQYLTKTKPLSLFLDSIKLLNQLKIPQLTYVVYPIKGGYRVFGKGLIGFLPKSHYKVCLFKRIKLYNFKSNFIVQAKMPKLPRITYFRYFLGFFFVNKLLCFINKTTIYYFLKRRKFISKQKSNIFFKYKPAKKCFSFKFIFLSPHIKNFVRDKQKKILTHKLSY